MARGGAADARRLELIGAKINPPAPTPPITIPGVGTLTLGSPPAPDARALLRGELTDLDRELAAAAGRAGDRTTRLHLQGSRDQIQKILYPDGPPTRR